jgi:uncharacterized LabA/DUF88 family protein
MWGTRKSALLVDFDNVLAMTNSSFVSSIAKWVDWLEDGIFSEPQKRRKFAVKRVYWNPLYDRYRESFEAAGFEAFACGAVVKSKKSSADSVIILDAIDVAGYMRDLEEVVLLTSDTDFVPVVNRLQARDVAVVVMGHEKNPTAEIYRRFADEVIIRSAFMDAFSYERPRRNWFGPKRERMVTTTTAPDAIKTPVAKNDDIDIAAERISDAAKEVGGAMLSRKAAILALQDMKTFSTVGSHAWLNFGSYKKMILAIVKRRADLRLYSYRNGGAAIAYRPPEAASRNASAG